MLDIKFVRENSEKVKAVCATKKDIADIDGIVSLDEKRREILNVLEKLKKERNDATKEISSIKKAKGDASEIIAKMGKVSGEIKKMDSELSEVISQIDEKMAKVPNIPHSSVPHGVSEDDNVVAETWGEKKVFDFNALDHMAISN